MNRTDLYPCAVDMHSHILPGIDDGSPTLAQSVSMAKIARAEGICLTVATPHLILDGTQDTLVYEASKRIAHLRAALKEAGVRMELRLGCELYLSSSIFSEPDISRYTVSFTRILLFETGDGCGPELLGDAASWMLDNGVIPLLAHPELIPWLEREHELLRKLCDKGMWLQLNAPSISGENGHTVQHRVKQLCRSGMHYVLGSDAHSADKRRPRMKGALEMLARWDGAQSAVSAAAFSARALMEL